jgi:hypothetical protein
LTANNTGVIIELIMEDILTFDPIKHCYSLNGKPMNGVSSILKRSGLVDFSGIPIETLERARQFGVAVHKVCELYDKKTLDVSSVAEPIFPYLEAWQAFLKDHTIEIIEIEKPVYSKRFWYAGTPDRIATMNGKPTILDLKSSSSIYPSMRLQLAAYQIAYEELKGGKIKQRVIVQLLKDGKYKLEPCADESDRDVFICAVNVAKWKRKNGLDVYKKGEEKNGSSRNGSGAEGSAGIS